MSLEKPSVPRLCPEVTTESLDPLDARSAVESTGSIRSRTCVYLHTEGFHFKTFLDWAVQDIQEARTHSDEAARKRLLVAALMNSRRALSCLVDYYLKRDGLAYCSDAPKVADEKASLLISRGIFDELAATALGRAIDRRNRVEHQYEIPDVVDVHDTVQLVRASIETAVTTSDPMRAAGFYNGFLGGHQTSGDETKFWFNGWSGVMFVLAVTETPPWFGVVVPSSSTKARLRHAPLKAFTCQQLLQLHALLDARSTSGFSGYGPQMFRGELRSAGLLPKT